MQSVRAMDATEPESGYWQRLLYRWFVEYNPLYLLSAALVLCGASLVANGLPDDASRLALAGVGAIPELYACALIAGAAFLMRIGQRRPAVMLALITALYQCDLTLHTDTCAYLGWIGVAGTAVWAGLFVAKLYALAWAMKLRLSRPAIAVAAFGALGVATIPHYVITGHEQIMTRVVALWMFALLAGGLWSVRRVDSAVRLDEWGETVKRRALRAVWGAWALFALLHVWFWCSEQGLGMDWLLPMAFVLSTRFMRREASVWAALTGTLLIVGFSFPGSLSSVALMAAAVLALRVFKEPRQISNAAAGPAPAGPYRAAAPRAVSVVARTEFGLAGPAAMVRLASGAVFGAYLSVWTSGWTGGPLPPHLLPLDLALTLVVLAGVWKARAHIALAPLTATWGHYLLASGIVPAPGTILGWGAASVGLGFGLLVASLSISYRLRNRAPSTS